MVSQTLNIAHDMQTLLTLTLDHAASDLHLSPNTQPRLRVDGDLHILTDTPIVDAHITKQLIYSFLTQTQQHQFESSRELDCCIVLPNTARFRVNIFHQAQGVSAAFRVIPNVIPQLDQLAPSMPFKDLLQLDNGLILITGPTGSGKSTTLAAMIDHVNSNQPCHIMTLEDPVEFIHTSKKSLVQQRQIYRDSLSFHAALRAALREDPDVILIGEMRDLETTRLALTAAETGHLVFATLHTASAPQAINRIIDIFPADEKHCIRHLIADVLQAVICQTLVKKRESGRMAAFEIMLATPAIRHLIRENKTAHMYSVIQTNQSIGMCTMQQSLEKLIAREGRNGER